MDYSAINQDPDHPTGASPWDSPRADRTTFPASVTSDIPPSPLPPQEQSPYGADHASKAPESPKRIINPEDDEPDSPDLSERLQSAQLGDPDYVEQPPYVTRAQYSQHQGSQIPARYQTGARQHAKQAPAWKLQAKITGLERTGKKDPILRFDVHVRNNWTSRVIARRADYFGRPIFPNSEQLNIETSAAPIPNSSNLLIT